MTYRVIPDTEIDQDSGVTVTLMSALRDNVDGAMAGDPNAPPLALKAIEAVTAGDAVRSSRAVNGVTDASHSFAVMQAGTIRAKGTALAPANWSVGRYRNASLTALGSGTGTTFSYDVAVLPFDLVVLSWTDGGGGSTNYTFSICTDGGNLWCGNPSTLVGVIGNDV